MAPGLLRLPANFLLCAERICPLTKDSPCDTKARISEISSHFLVVLLFGRVERRCSSFDGYGRCICRLRFLLSGVESIKKMRRVDDLLRVGLVIESAYV